MDTPSESELIARAQEGSVEAVGRLYEDHYQSVYRYLAYRTQDLQTAEDLTADVFLRMIKSLPGFRQRAASVRAWLLQIAHNLVVDQYRHASVRPIVTLQEDLPARNDAPEAIAAQNLSSERLRRALDQLNEEQREVLILRFIDDLPVSQVAQVLHRSEDSIKGLQRRGLVALRKILAGEEVPDVEP